MPICPSLSLVADEKRPRLKTSAVCGGPCSAQRCNSSGATAGTAQPMLGHINLSTTTEAAVQAFEEADPGGLARRDVVSLDAVLHLPLQEARDAFRRSRVQTEGKPGGNVKRPVTSTASCASAAPRPLPLCAGTLHRVHAFRDQTLEFAG